MAEDLYFPMVIHYPLSSKNTLRSHAHKTCACCYGDVQILAGRGEDVINPQGRSSAANVANQSRGCLWAGTERL